MRRVTNINLPEEFKGKRLGEVFFMEPTLVIEAGTILTGVCYYFQLAEDYTLFNYPRDFTYIEGSVVDSFGETIPIGSRNPRVLRFPDDRQLEWYEKQHTV